MTNDDEITVFDWNNRLSVYGVMSVGYDDDVRLMDILVTLMTID